MSSPSRKPLSRMKVEFEGWRAVMLDRQEFSLESGVPVEWLTRISQLIATESGHFQFQPIGHGREGWRYEYHRH